MAPMFTYSVKDLANVVRICEPLPPRWLNEILDGTEVVAAGSADGLLEASLTLTGRNVLVRGKVRATVVMPCARCLQPASVAIAGELTLLLVPDSPPKTKVPNSKSGKKSAKAANDPAEKRRRRPDSDDDDDERLMDPSEAETDTYSGDDVVLDRFVREAILLELPMFPLCFDACPGIGAAPSDTAESAIEDSPIDPRLAPLLELKNKSKI